jgi:hypothetical protein
VIRDIKILLIGGKWITYFNVIICFVGGFNFSDGEGLLYGMRDPYSSTIEAILDD